MQTPKLIDVPYLIAQLDFSKNTTDSCVVMGGTEQLLNVNEIALKLYATGFMGQVVFMPPGITLEMLDKDDMEQAGWVRKTSRK